MAVGGDVEGGAVVGDGAPEGALLPGVAPAGLIDKEDRGIFDRLAQLRIGHLQCPGGALAALSRPSRSRQSCQTFGAFAELHPGGHSAPGWLRFAWNVAGTRRDIQERG
jgi:hypothetical protein